jgi:hypothetical protein
MEVLESSTRPEEDFFPKGSEGWVPIAADVLAEVLRYQPLCTEGYLIPGRTATERHEVVYRRHSKWVSAWIKDRTKTSYELRDMLDRGCSTWVQRSLRSGISSAIATSRRRKLWYALSAAESPVKNHWNG